MRDALKIKESDEKIKKLEHKILLARQDKHNITLECESRNKNIANIKDYLQENILNDIPVIEILEN